MPAMDLMQFDVQTATASVSDLRLQVVDVEEQEEEKGERKVEVKRPRRPRWFRERLLTTQDEIVDRLVDANTAHVAWTAHRPVRGWYLHLRSPHLPPGSAIPLRPSRTAAADPSSTPLTFTIGTSIDLGTLRHTRPFIEEQGENSEGRASAATAAGRSQLASSNDQSRRTRHPDSRFSGAFTTVALDQSHEPDLSSLNAHKEDENLSSNPHEQVAARSTAREDGISGRANGHARRRSAGVSSSGQAGSRHVSSSSQLDGTAPPTIVVEEEEEAEEAMPSGENGDSCRRGRDLIGDPLQSADQPYAEPASPRTISSRGSSKSSRKLKIDTSSSAHPRVPSSSNSSTSPSLSMAKSSAAAATDTSGSARPPQSTRSSRRAAPRACNFLITDGSGASTNAWLVESQMAPGRIAEGGHRLGWARWAWSLMPEPIRPPLAIDTSKTFSLRWLDPPRVMHDQRDNGRVNGGSSGSNHDVASERDHHNAEGGGEEIAAIEGTSGPGIEVLRFEDRSGWWFWKAKEKGRITLQAQAVRCLGIDVGFWIALALAYLEQLEERDGYNAAADG